jgi:hypothetical protein
MRKNLFVKYDCGCFGLPPAEDGRAWIICKCVQCGSTLMDSQKPLFVERRVEGKKWNWATEEGTDYYLKLLQDLLHDGRRYREIRALLED